MLARKETHGKRQRKEEIFISRQLYRRKVTQGNNRKVTQGKTAWRERACSASFRTLWVSWFLRCSPSRVKCYVHTRCRAASAGGWTKIICCPRWGRGRGRNFLHFMEHSTVIWAQSTRSLSGAPYSFQHPNPQVFPTEVGEATGEALFNICTDLLMEEQCSQWSLVSPWPHVRIYFRLSWIVLQAQSSSPHLRA